MAQLAILGHATRGREVINILKMLGGKTSMILCGDLTFHGYYINADGFIDYTHCSDFNNDIIYSLEEFLEKFPYKIGDNVIFNESKAEIVSMKWDGVDIIYTVNRNDELWNTIAINLQPYKEAPMYLNKKANKQFEEIKKILEQVKEIMEERDKAKAPDLKGEDYSFRRFGYKIPKGYEFECVRENEIILKPIKLFPKTYEECCKILNLTKYPPALVPNKDMFINQYEDFPYYYEIQKLAELIVCRNAYWKIAGEQMGLGKPWELPFNENQDSDPIYFIVNKLGKIYKDNANIIISNRILAFPTAEMQGAFYENFKDSIELCKELL